LNPVRFHYTEDYLHEHPGCADKERFGIVAPDPGGPITGGNYSLTGGFWSHFAVQAPGLPTLFITRSGNNAILRWSANAADFVLEHKSSLAAPTGWTLVSHLR